MSEDEGLLRDAIAEALQRHLACALPRSTRATWVGAADALLPVVTAGAQERAAKELRAAADMDGVIMSMDWSVKAPLAGVLDAYAAMLRRRADALDPPRDRGQS